MNTRVLWIALVLSLAAVSVSATEPPPTVPAPSSQAAEAPSKTGSKRLTEPCEPAPGSHLSRKRKADGTCETDPFGGRTYTSEDLERTGQTDLGEALKRLDPSIR